MTVQIKRGFTLIELLVVIAILATLAVVVLLALNPVQQLARARDSGRINSVTQLGRTLESFAAVKGSYPTNNATGTCVLSGSTYPTGANWITNCLMNTQEIKAVPTNPVYSTLATQPTCPAASVSEGNYCYVGSNTAAVVYAQAEAMSNTTRCATGETAYMVYATGAGRGGLWCGAAAPTNAITGSDAGWKL